MECTIKFLLWSGILTVVLCSATLCGEVGTGNDEKDATSLLQPTSWNKFNDKIAEPPSCPDTWFVPIVETPASVERPTMILSIAMRTRRKLECLIVTV